MNINMNIKQMADEDNLECVFYFLINDARKDREIKDEAGKRICQHFMSVVDVSRYGICSGAITRDSASLRGRVNALLPVRAEFILIEPEKDLICLLTPEQRDRFMERLKTYNGDTVELAVAILAEDELGPYCGDIGAYRAEIAQIYERLRGLLAEYTETNCYNVVPERASDPDGLAYTTRRLEEIRDEAAPLERCPEVMERLARFLSETEHFLRQYEQPGVVARWRELNPPIEFFDCAFDLLEEEPELFEQIRTGRCGPLYLECCPGPKDLRRRQDYFAAVRRRFARDGREYSDDAAFQDELCRTLDLVFRADFGEAWEGVGAGAPALHTNLRRFYVREQGTGVAGDTGNLEWHSAGKL